MISFRRSRNIQSCGSVKIGMKEEEDDDDEEEEDDDDDDDDDEDDDEDEEEEEDDDDDALWGCTESVSGLSPDEEWFLSAALITAHAFVNNNESDSLLAIVGFLSTNCLRTVKPVVIVSLSARSP